MNLRRFFIAVVGLLLFSLSGVMAQETQTLRYPILREPEHLNPFLSNTRATRHVLVNVYEALTGLAPDGSGMEPVLAESWDISPDGLTYTFNLRRGVLFQEVAGVTYESREVTAEDWLWSMKMFLSGDPEISRHADYLRSIAGAQAFTDGTVSEVEGIEVVDDYTLRITLEKPSHRFLIDLQNVYVIPREAYEQLGDEFANHPVGTGPFIFDSWEAGQGIRLVANPDYWDEGLPKLDAVELIVVPDAETELEMYRNGELDVLVDFPSGQRVAVRDEFAAEYHELPGLNVRYYGFDMSQGFFAEHPLVRQAFAYALDRDRIWNEALEGERIPGNLGILPPTFPASDVEGYRYNLDRAAELLAEAGFPNGEGLPEFELYVFASDADSPAHQIYKESLAQIGVTLNIVAEDSSTYWSHIREPDVIFFLSGWSASYPDPSAVLNQLAFNGNDDTFYNNFEVNNLLERAMTITDDGRRNTLYRRVHEIIMADAPFVVSAYSKVIYLLKPHVQDFFASSAGVYRTPLKYAWLDN